MHVVDKYSSFVDGNKKNTKRSLGNSKKCVFLSKFCKLGL